MKSTSADTPVRYPAEGGSYIRDTKTGELTRVEEPTAPPIGKSEALARVTPGAEPAQRGGRRRKGTSDTTSAAPTSDATAPPTPAAPDTTHGEEQ